MSIFKLSEEQEAAVDISQNIAVSAGAGSGKTRVLTNRFLKLLEAGLNIEEIAAITFTEKAALEMKERIRAAINEKLQHTDNDKWRNILDKLTRANISTIHGFCAKIVRENAASVGIDFKFSIIGDVEKREALYNIYNSVLKQFYETAEYNDIISNITELYGKGYFASGMLKELLNVRTKIKNEGKKTETLYAEYSKDPLIEFLLSLLINIDKAYTNFKLTEDVLDYDDLENYCYDIVQNKEIMKRYKNRYKRFLVDEFQDTNIIQKNIIYSFVSDENNELMDKRLFVVGDPKQSIYGFRGADHEVFEKVSEDIGINGSKCLSDCYRSKNEIIIGINEIFKKLIKNYEPLVCPDKNAEIAQKRIIILNYKNEKQNNSITEIKEAIRSNNFDQFSSTLEKLKVDQNIKNDDNIDGNAVIKGIEILLNKGLRYKDICILVRSKYLIDNIEGQLKKYNIPYCIIGGRGFYNKAEVAEILNLLKVINDGFSGQELNEKNIIRLLRSYIFNVPDDLLYKIKIEQLENNCTNYFEAAAYVIDGLSKAEHGDILRYAYLSLKELAELKEKLSVAELLKAIIKKLGIKEKVLSQENGRQKYRNIEKLILTADTLDKENLFSFEEFIEYIDKLNDNNSDEAEASLDTEDTEAVKIMTIHQSKGLEFEGVILPGMDKDQLYTTNEELENENFIYYNSKIISRYIMESDYEESEDYRSYKEYRLLKEIEEVTRILYVALTRAKQYILMTGKESEQEPAEILEEKDKIKQLNTFMKQIKYALKTGEADAVIDFINYEAAEDLAVVKSTKINEEKIKTEAIEKRLQFNCEATGRKYISASKYMKYKKCPRRFFVESILNVKLNRLSLNESYDDTSQEEASVEADEFEDENTNVTISASELGSFVHKTLEYKVKTKLNNYEIINKAYSNMFGQEKALSEAEKADIFRKAEQFIKNYEKIEENRIPLGELVYCEEEAEYTIALIKDIKTLIAGFIDRLEVYKKDSKYIAVITDYKTNHIYGDKIDELTKVYAEQLNIYGKAVKAALSIDGRKIDEIKLYLYFLDAAVAKEVTFDEEKITEKIEDMVNVLCKDFNKLSIDFYPKAEGGQCEKCDYESVCVSRI